MKREIGKVAIFRTDGLYLTIGGGTFEHEGVKGSFAATANGTALVIYIDGSNESYAVNVEDAIHEILEKRK